MCCSAFLIKTQTLPCNFIMKRVSYKGVFICILSNVSEYFFSNTPPGYYLCWIPFCLLRLLQPQNVILDFRYFSIILKSNILGANTEGRLKTTVSKSPRELAVPVPLYLSIFILYTYISIYMCIYPSVDNIYLRKKYNLFSTESFMLNLQLELLHYVIYLPENW